MTRLRPLALALALASGAALAGCDHVTTPDGPNLDDRFGPFVLVEPLAADRDAVDFAAGEGVTFTARFNKPTEWVLEIVGQESGAVRRITGLSRELNADNARWRGRTTELPFFRAEAVTATLSFPNEPDGAPTTDDVTVTTPRVYPGNVLADFEGETDVFVGNFEFEFEGAGVTSEPAAGEGEQFYLLRGTDDVVNNFFAGLIDIRPEGRGVFAVPTTIPEDLYFNFMLRGYEDVDFTIAVIQLIVDANGTGQYELDRDTYVPFGDIPVDFSGWRLFSASFDALGLTEEQAGAVVGVRVVLISDNNAQPSPPRQVAFGLDYVTFTAGGPLQP